MTYVASPSHAINDPARTDDLRQCLETARRRLDEVSKSSSVEKEAEIISSAIGAGWNEEEVIIALNPAREPDGRKPTIGLVPSSSM
ncbi:hypothetical protein DTW90_29100 [Neorhizobium sp. P12A]|uniref:hypothetical protein n=1 Tax=Rhizobium/Agrobacterium group TaxID=227290 RepID=UPI001049F7FA|nr:MULTISPECIES: hypothetical protein [Rhizobium/Agrobacterium group]KAA0690951.1 hypothetical protein DTW90_29100 [Neorhizobium sp. P12A]TCR87663.1 hypothetical protein EV561_1058 [Rhizobium sp. BK376]